jgi:hypothetical protein
MAYFAAREGKPADFCQRRVLDCDVYVGLIGLRYGSIVPSSDISYTEMEFRTASTARIPRLLFLLDVDARIPPRLVDVDRRRIEQFRQDIQKAGVVAKTFAGADKLGAAVLQAPMTLESTVMPPTMGQGGRRPRMAPVLTGPVVDRPEVAAEVFAGVIAPGSGPGAADDRVGRRRWRGEDHPGGAGVPPARGGAAVPGWDAVGHARRAGTGPRSWRH